MGGGGAGAVSMAVRPIQYYLPRRDETRSYYVIRAGLPGIIYRSIIVSTTLHSYFSSELTQTLSQTLVILIDCTLISHMSLPSRRTSTHRRARPTATHRQSAVPHRSEYTT